jgi:hypothetical protein
MADDGRKMNLGTRTRQQVPAPRFPNADMRPARFGAIVRRMRLMYFWSIRLRRMEESGFGVSTALDENRAKI